MTTEEEKRRQDREAALEKFIADLGLEWWPYGRNVAAITRRFCWPKAKNGGQYDRAIHLTVFEDGTWSEAMDTATHGIADTKASLRRMARADDAFRVLRKLCKDIDRADLDKNYHPDWAEACALVDAVPE